MQKKGLIIGSLFILLLFLAACQTAKVYVCPDGLNVDDPAKCQVQAQPAPATPEAAPPVDAPVAETTAAPPEQVAPPPTPVTTVTGATVVTPVSEDSSNKNADAPNVTEETTPAVSTQSAPVSSGLAFDVVDLQYNPYRISEMTYKITNNADKPIDGTLEIFVPTNKEGEMVRIKRIDFPRIRPGETKQVRKSIDADLFLIDVSQKAYFNVYENTATSVKGVLLASDTYDIVIKK